LALFFPAPKPEYRHNILSKRRLRHFAHPVNWLCFFKSPIRIYSHFAFLLFPEIGFVRVCFSLPKTTLNHHNLRKLLLLLTLHHIAHINIGFVFSNAPYQLVSRPTRGNRHPAMPPELSDFVFRA